MKSGAWINNTLFLYRILGLDSVILYISSQVCILYHNSLITKYIEAGITKKTLGVSVKDMRGKDKSMDIQTLQKPLLLVRGRDFE